MRSLFALKFVAAATLCAAGLAPAQAEDGYQLWLRDGVDGVQAPDRLPREVEAACDAPGTPATLSVGGGMPGASAVSATVRFAQHD